MKHALIVSPYLDHLGGGERYMLSVAEVLEQQGYDIYFAWDNLQEIGNLCTMLGITLASPKLDPHVRELYSSRSPLAMYLATRKYDVIVYLSDGSLPMLGGRNNIVHMQVPFHDVGGRSFKNAIKKRSIDQYIVNSQFTKGVVDKEYGIDSVVVYPPVHIEKQDLPKDKVILSVGRFEPSLNAKKQDIMIDAFKAVSHELPGWKLVLAGGSSSEDWLGQLRAKIGDTPIELRANISHDNLVRLYATSRIYWHAAGYGVDEHKNPELVEHFGITTAEAIGNGCIPLVVPRGGQKEIVTDPELYWETEEELGSKTLAIVEGIIKQDVIKKFDISRYSYDHFAQSLKEIIK